MLKPINLHNTASVPLKKNKYRNIRVRIWGSLVADGNILRNDGTKYYGSLSMSDAFKENCINVKVIVTMYATFL